MNPETMTVLSSSRSRDATIDWLKGVSIIFVLIWHFQPIQIDYHLPKYTSEKIIGYTIHLINSQVLCLAVPTFILISLYLFLSKIQKLNFIDAKKNLTARSIRVFSLYFFYVMIQFLLFFTFRKFLPEFSIPVLSLPMQNAVSVDNLSLIVGNLFSGGPPLPIINYSVLYFLFDLAVLTAMSFIFNRFCPPNTLTAKFTSLIVISLTIFLFEASPFIANKIYPHQLENFILYVPIAAFWACNKEKFMSYRRLYLVGYVLFIVHDIFLERYSLRGEMYSRTSIIFGSLAFISFAYYYFSKNIISLNPSLQFMSSHSLGIFAIHKYSMLALVFVAEKIGDVLHQKPAWDYTVSIGDIKFRMIIFLLSVLSVTLTIAIVHSLGKSKFKLLVM